MYSIDRRIIALRIYSLLSSLRKTAILLQVSHSSVARWAVQCHPKRYDSSRRYSKSQCVIECIRSAVANDPFLSLVRLQRIVNRTLGILISKELARLVLKKQGFTKKKARFHGHPKCLEDKVEKFLRARNDFIRQGKRFVSVDETAFGRNTATCVYGYAKRGTPLYIKRDNSPRVTTTSALVAIDSIDGSVRSRSKTGSFDTNSFRETLEQFDIPRDTVVLLDNVAFHHSKKVSDFASERGLHLLFVPPYSPWFNPVEGVFSIVTSNIRNALDAVQQRHVFAFFRHSLRLQNAPTSAYKALTDLYLQQE